MSEGLPLPGPRARTLAASIERMLRELAAAGRPVGDAELDVLFGEMDHFHATLLEEANCVARCARGCSSCCSQAVFDVHAFEVERIGRRLRREGRQEEVLARASERNARHDEVRRAHPREPGEDHDAWIERVALEFWKRDLPCPLLAADGACSVHEDRPWSCRRFFSLSDPALCRGETARHPDRRGVILDPVEDVDTLLARFDRWVQFEPETDRLDLALERWLRSRSTEEPGA